MKYRNRKTGEVVDVISYSCYSTRGKNDSLAYIDSKGIEHPREEGNIYWDYEPVEEPTELQQQINWEERLWQLFSKIMARHSDLSDCPREVKEMTNDAIRVALTALEEYKSKQKQLWKRMN